MNEQSLKQLLDAGLISQETFDKMAPAKTQAQVVDRGVIDPGQAVLKPIGEGIMSVGRGIGGAINTVGGGLSRLIAPEAAQQLPSMTEQPNAAQVSAPAPGERAAELTAEDLAAQEQASALAAQQSEAEQRQAEEDALNKQFSAARGMVSGAVADVNRIASEEKSIMDAQQKAAAEFDAESDEKRAKAQERIDTEFEEVKSRFDQIANEQIDPNRYWKQIGTSGRVRSAIAIILGGIGAGYSGGENQALKMINDLVDKDISAQEKNIDLKSKAANQNLNIFNVYKGILKDKEDARAATRLELMQRYKMSLDAAASQYKAPEFRLKMADVQAKLDQQMAEQRAALEASRERKAMNAVLRGDTTGTSEEAQIAAIDQLQQSPEKADRERAADLRDRYVPGLGISNANKETVSEFRKYAAESQPAITTINRIVSFVTSGEYNKLNLKDRARIESEIKGVVGSLRLPIVGPGALTEPEREMLQQIVGNPNNIFAFRSVELTKLDTIKKKLETDLRDKAKSAGFKNANQPSSFKPR